MAWDVLHLIHMWVVHHKPACLQPHTGVAGPVHMKSSLNMVWPGKSYGVDGHLAQNLLQLTRCFSVSTSGPRETQIFPHLFGDLPMKAQIL